MHPILASLPVFTLFGHVIGPIRFYSYGLCLATALGFSIYLYARDVGRHLAPSLGLTYDQAFQKVFDMGMWVIVFSLVGARIFYVLENHAQFQNGHWGDAVKIWQGGLVYYGGFFGAIVAGLAWFRAEKWPMVRCFDLVAPYISLGQAIGRVGCFLNGCCYGNIASPHHGILDWTHGWVFPGGEDQLPHYPTQLWELVGDLALFAVLLWGRRWTIRYPWLTFSLYGLAYGFLRLVIEFWRRDWNKHYLVIFNSASQAVSGLMILVSIAAVLWILFVHRKAQPDPAP